nr:pyruvate ferredoxin oxidoreductase [uncultured Prevotella sp.]
MDYKYINQLVERYWRCETSLEEEAILRAFFSQEDIPAELLKYKEIFCYQQQETKEDVLGEDFDKRMLARIAGPVKVKARMITMTDRLKPLFKAAAIVAIVLTLGNAAQVPFSEDAYPGDEMVKFHHTGISVALGDSAVIDSMQHSSLDMVETPNPNLN